MLGTRKRRFYFPNENRLGAGRLLSPLPRFCSPCRRAVRSFVACPSQRRRVAFAEIRGVASRRLESGRRPFSIDHLLSRRKLRNRTLATRRRELARRDANFTRRRARRDVGRILFAPPRRRFRLGIDVANRRKHPLAQRRPGDGAFARPANVRTPRTFNV